MRKCIIAVLLIGAALAVQPFSSICPITHAVEAAPDAAIEAEKQQAEALEVETITHLRILSALYLKQHMFDKAVECLEKICLLQPDNLDVLNDLVNLALHVQNYKDAEDPLKKLYDVKPGDRGTLLALAACYKGLQDEKYGEYLEKADASEFAGNPYIDSAAYFEQFGMTELVYAELQKELDLPLSDPKNSPALRMSALQKMAFYLSDEAKYAEAAQTYNRLLAEMEQAGLAAIGEYNQTASQMSYCQAMQLERDGKADEARQKYEKAARLSPDDVDAQGHLYVLLMGQGKTDDAKRVFEAAEAVLVARTAGETDDSAMNALSWFYAVTGEKIDEGIRLAQRAVTSRPDEPAFLDTLAELYYVKAKSQEDTTQKKGSLTNAIKCASTADAIPKRGNVPYYKRQFLKMLMEFVRQFGNQEGGSNPLP
jgi:tetratricopeptide (TPR) repeat protein